VLEQRRNIVPLYAARVEELTHAATVSVSCTCGHKAEIPVATITAKLPGFYHVSDISRVLRCRRCSARGDCTETGDVRVNPREALGYAVPSPDPV
jgi:hypothetical protein